VLGIDPRTVAKWLARARYERPRPIPRSSLLDPFKGRITRLLDTHPYSAQQIFQRLREEGYGGGITILRDYVRLILARAKREKLLQQLESILHDQVVQAPIYHNGFSIAKSRLTCRLIASALEVSRPLILASTGTA
jgi:hypothetical protein